MSSKGGCYSTSDDLSCSYYFHNVYGKVLMFRMCIYGGKYFTTSPLGPSQ